MSEGDGGMGWDGYSHCPELNYTLLYRAVVPSPRRNYPRRYIVE